MSDLTIALPVEVCAGLTALLDEVPLRGAERKQAALLFQVAVSQAAQVAVQDLATADNIPEVPEPEGEESQ